MAKIVKKKNVSKSKKVVAKKSAPKKPEDKKAPADPNDIEAGVKFKDRTYLTPDHRARALQLMHDRDLAQKSMQISEQEVRNMVLEIKIMQDINLRNAKEHLESKSASYVAVDKQVKEFLDDLKDMYGINGDLRFNPASGKIVK